MKLPPPKKNDISARQKRIQIRKTEIKQTYKIKPMSKKMS